jgi:cytochrome d ubiquinol oxidase subunit I
VVYRVLRTEDAVTQAGGVPVSLAAVMVLYTVLGVSTVLVLRAMARRWRAAEEVDVPYGPRPAPAPDLTETPS